MSTPYNKYEHYMNNVTEQEYIEDEKQYLSKAVKLKQYLDGTEPDQYMNKAVMGAALTGLVLCKDEDITDEEYRFYWVMLDTDGVSESADYRVVEPEFVAKFREQ